MQHQQQRAYFMYSVFFYGGLPIRNYTAGYNIRDILSPRNYPRLRGRDLLPFFFFFIFYWVYADDDDYYIIVVVVPFFFFFFGTLTKMISGVM